MRSTALSSPSPLLAAPEKAGSRYQLPLLDIEPGGRNSPDLTGWLRYNQRGVQTGLHDQLPGLCVRHLRYPAFHNLLKPLDQEKPASVIRWDYRRNYSNAQLRPKFGGTHLSLPYRDIYAMEVTQHRAPLHLWDRAEP